MTRHSFPKRLLSRATKSPLKYAKSDSVVPIKPYIANLHSGHSKGLSPNSKLDILVSFSAFDHVDLISPRPLLLIAGTDAYTLYFSEIAYKKNKEPKELFLIDGATHIDLYDKEQYVGPAVKKLDNFTQYLSGN
ncbi:hypothetical protein K7432_015714 [Basidiobolus ranarum]|uniref:Uncharacterized protein n=1 Tax=Basidiobolus ranarum TaxID=34480 RepID=A0ABR2WFT4_9FUNG